MHEMSLAENMLELVIETARREQAQRVRRIILDIGTLAAVEADALSFCFDAVARGTVAEGAILEIIVIDAAGHCQDCGEGQAIAAFGEACRRCGSYRLEATTGTGMQVREIDIV